MSKTGNDLWWSQVVNYQQDHGCTADEAELEVFTHLLRTMIMDGKGMEGARAHFKEAFGLGKSAFYTRMKKMGVRWVLPLELRKEK